MLIHKSIIVQENIDGYSERYRCTTSLFILSCLAHSSNVIIDDAIYAPGLEKLIVDGINAKGEIIYINIMNNTQFSEVK